MCYGCARGDQTHARPSLEIHAVLACIHTPARHSRRLKIIWEFGGSSRPASKLGRPDTARSIDSAPADGTKEPAPNWAQNTPRTSPHPATRRKAQPRKTGARPADQPGLEDRQQRACPYLRAIRTGGQQRSACQHAAEMKWDPLCRQLQACQHVRPLLWESCSLKNGQHFPLPEGSEKCSESPPSWGPS